MYIVAIILLLKFQFHYFSSVSSEDTVDEITTEAISSQKTDVFLKYPLSEEGEKFPNIHSSTETENVANFAVDLVVADESFILENKDMNEMILKDKSAKSDASNLEAKENILHNSTEEILNRTEPIPITSDIVTSHNRLNTKLNSTETMASSPYDSEEVQKNLTSIKSMNEKNSMSSELQKESLEDFAQVVSENNLKAPEVISESNDSGAEISRSSMCKEVPKAIEIILRKPVIFICIFCFCQGNVVIFIIMF